MTSSIVAGVPVRAQKIHNKIGFIILKSHVEPKSHYLNLILCFSAHPQEQMFLLTLPLEEYKVPTPYP